jgi:hypothetical protein
MGGIRAGSAGAAFFGCAGLKMGIYLRIKWAMAFSSPSMESSNMGKIRPIKPMVRV